MINLGRLFRNIPVKVHWLTLAFFAYVLVAHGLSFFAILLGAFGLVFLHEHGHIKAAEMYGIKTKYIVFLPFGAAAVMPTVGDHERKNWKRELIISAAGPAVNFVLAPLFLLLAFITVPIPQVSTIMTYAAIINLAIGLFNLLPAFPMDGGRILRSIFLYYTGDFLKSTIWSVWTARVMSILVLLPYAIWAQSLTLPVIIVLIWLYGIAEIKRASIGLVIDKHEEPEDEKEARCAKLEKEGFNG